MKNLRESGLGQKHLEKITAVHGSEKAARDVAGKTDRLVNAAYKSLMSHRKEFLNSGAITGEEENKKLLAVAGIGNPENFFTLIKENNLVIAKKLVFPDHYQFSKEEIQDIIREAESKNYKIIMTEKDYFKIKDYNFEKIHFLKISLEINRKQELLKKINQYD